MADLFVNCLLQTIRPLDWIGNRYTTCSVFMVLYNMIEKGKRYIKLNGFLINNSQVVARIVTAVSEQIAIAWKYIFFRNS